MKSAAVAFHSEDILFGRLRPYLNKVFRPNFDGCCSAEFIPLTAENGISAPFIERIVSSSDFVQFTGTLDEGDRPRVNYDGISEYALGLPPEPEQRRIVAKLDALQSRTRLAREALAAIPTLLDHYRQSVLTYSLRSNADESNLVPFTSVFDYKGGTQPPKSYFSDHPVPGHIRLLQIRDFESDDKAVFIKNSNKWSKCDINDIMIARYGASLGRILRGKAGAYNVALVRVIFDSKRIEPDWAFHFLKSAVFQGYLQTLSRSAQDGFNKDDLSRLMIFIPKLPEQKRIAKEIELRLSRIQEIEQLVNNLLSEASHLDQSLLATAFRGELVPQDPNDEPASILLDRIRAARAQADAAPRSRRPRAASLPTATTKREPKHPADAFSAKKSSGNDSKTLLAALRKRGSLSNAEAQAITGHDPAQVRTWLKDLVTQGHARTEGQKRGMRYVAV